MKGLPEWQKGPKCKPSPTKICFIYAGPHRQRCALVRIFAFQSGPDLTKKQGPPCLTLLVSPVGPRFGRWVG